MMSYARHLLLRLSMHHLFVSWRDLTLVSNIKQKPMSDCLKLPTSSSCDPSLTSLL